MLLIVAGHETTVSLIGNAVLALLRHPDELEKLEADPSLVAAVDVELAGHTIKRCDTVIAILGAADRDPSRFEEPERLLLERGDNKHLAVGRGSHFCLGAPLVARDCSLSLPSPAK